MENETLMQREEVLDRGLLMGDLFSHRFSHRYALTNNTIFIKSKKVAGAFKTATKTLRH